MSRSPEATRVVGFAFAEPVAVSGWCADVPRGLACPVSPLGTLLQKNSGESSCSDLPGSSTTSAAKIDVGNAQTCFDATVKQQPAQVYSNVMMVRPDVQSQEIAVLRADSDSSYGDDTVLSASCLTCSEPIPIPEPKPKTPEPSRQPKLIKRVPEPPMIRAVTAPAIVEELYAEYEKAKQHVIEQQLYQQMLASQGMPARMLNSRRKSVDPPKAAAMAPEMDKLSWRTVYTHMQTHGYSKRMSTCQ